MLSTVLVPTDLSASQEGVMRFVSGLPTIGVRRVVCCHVVDLRVATGDPHRELLMIASEEHVEAIVAGSSGKGPADRMFVGSVSERLARDAGIPSLTLRFDMLRAAEDPADLARHFARMLLVPTDFSATAARALNVALSFPKQAVGAMRILNVIHGPGAPEDDTDAQLRKLAEIAKGRGVHATPVVGHGAPEKAILAEIDTSGITGVVIGTRGRSPLQEALLGSVSMTLIRQASVPVLVVP